MSPKHYSIEGHVHYLTFSCYQKLWLFKSPSLYAQFLKNLDISRDRYNLKLYGFVLMSNHVHLLFYPPLDVSISNVLKAIKRPFSYQALAYLEEHQPELADRLIVQKGNRQVRRFWQAGGGYDRNICRDETFVHTLEYMHFNPVRKGLVKSPLDWKWSSARFYQTRAADLIRLDWPAWG